MEILIILGDILLFILVLSIVICIHELGHFFFARKAGILCHEFAFGMGPRLWSKKIGETIFSIRAFPFGGFVSMAGEEIDAEVVKVGDKIRIAFDENHLVNRIVVNPNNPKFLDLTEVTITSLDLKGTSETGLHINEFPVKPSAFYVFDKSTIQIAPLNRNFNFKNKRQRFLTTIGGPMMNIFLAFLVFWLIALIYGIAQVGSAEVGAVSVPSVEDGVYAPAYGVVETGDFITAVNGVSVTAWATEDESVATVTSELAKYTEYDTVVLTVLRDGVSLTLAPITPQFFFYGLGFAGVPGSTEPKVATPLYQEYTYSGSLNEETLKINDVIVSIDGTAVSTWDDLFAYSLAHPDGSTDANPTVLVVDRTVASVTTRHTIEYVAYGVETLKAMGFEPFFSRIGITCTTGFDFFGSFGAALESLGNASISIYRTLWLLITSNQVNVGDLSGFIGIYSATANAAAQGFQTLLGWVGLLSVNLGIVNLLPIPALDGGRLAFIAYEAVSGKKPNRKFENTLNTIMLFLLLGLMVFITYKDITRLF